MGFYQDISNNFGAQTSNKLKRWSNLNIKAANLINRRIFLHQCKNNGVPPNHVTNSTRSLFKLFGEGNQPLERKILDFNTRLMFKIISLEISHVNFQIVQNTKFINKLKSDLQQLLPQYIFLEFERRSTIKFNKVFHNVKVTNLNKLNNLKQNYRDKYKIQEKWFVNLSRTNVPQDVKITLALGPKFSFKSTIKDIHIGKLVADIEGLLSLVSEDRKDFYRAKTTSIITGFIHKNKNKEIRHLTDVQYLQTKRYLKENSNLIVLNSDKGGVTVVMDKEQYALKMNDILTDQDSFKVLRGDPTRTVQTKANNYISKLEKYQHLTKEQAKAYKIYNSICPRIYGNPKLHKQDVPLRPIVSGIQSPTTLLCKLLCGVLSAAYDTNNAYYIKDTFAFAEFANDMQVPPGHEVVSLDVINLFGNISKDLVVKVIDQQWDKIDPFFSCPKVPTKNKRKQIFTEMIIFTLDNNYFNYDNVYYKQIFGCSMGSKLSPILAQYVMDYLLDTCIPKLSFNLIFIKKFVDDLILVLPTQGLEEILVTFNGFNEHIKFTMEREVDCGVPFLDTRVIRQNNKIILDWYQKPTSSGRYINFQSDHSTKIKINFMKQMKSRIIKISHPSFKEKNVNKLKLLLLQNSYPPGLVNKILYSTSSFSPQNVVAQRPQTISAPNDLAGEEGGDVNVGEDQPAEGVVDGGQPCRFGSLPNITGLTVRLIRTFHNENIKIAIKNSKKGSSLFSKLKSKIPLKFQSSVVYSVQCESCGSRYVGQTSQWVTNRLALHKSDIANKRDRCALAEHVLKNNHQVDWESIKILEKEQNTNKRLILEMYQINKTENTINKKSDTQKLSNIYTYLLSSEILQV